DGDQQPLAFDNMANRGPRGTTDWKPFSIELTVAPNARKIVLGLMHTGSGTAWFSGVRLTLDGVPYASDQLDFGFSEWPATGFGGGGTGYQIAVDNDVQYDGKSSLRIRRTGRAAVQPQGMPQGFVPDPAREWHDIYNEMKSKHSSTPEG